MSSILKALKKLEEEKALQQEGKEINLSQDILRQNPQNRKMVLWFWITGVTAISIIIVLVLLLFKESLFKNRKETDTAAYLPHREQKDPAAIIKNRSPRPAARNRQNSIAPHTPPQTIEQPARAVIPSPMQAPPTAKQIKSEEYVNHQTGLKNLRAESENKPLPPALPDQGTTLTLSGIAWSQDSANRLAIINGQPTATGATVGGVVIEEIMPDRIKAISNGKSFEIILGKTAKSE